MIPQTHGRDERDADAPTTITPTTPPLVAAHHYRLNRGWAPIPVPVQSKNPNRAGWQRLILSTDELPQHFNAAAQNLGLLLGEPSGGLVDVDLDSPEALRLADLFLPPTPCVFGRASKPRSHRLYRVMGEVRTIRYQDPAPTTDERAMLLELRSTGLQTIVPPSIHPSGESIVWDADGEPPVVEAVELQRSCARLAAASSMTRHWPGEGARHQAALALSGALLHSGWNAAETNQFVVAVAVAAGDDEPDDRSRAAASTAVARAADRPTTGWPTLGQVVDHRVVDGVHAWLGLDAPPSGVSGAANSSNDSFVRTVANALPPVPPFPITVLPLVLARFVEEYAAARGAPPDMVAVPLLVFAAATIGRTRRLRLKPGWEVRPILWAAVVGRPGTAKSPALSASQSLVSTLQQEAIEDYRVAMAKYRRDLAAAEADGARRDERPSKPALEHYSTTDATKEALAPMARDSAGLAIVRDELVAWVGSFDAYRSGRGGDRQDFLALWSGAELKIDRKRDEPIFVREPTISIVGGIQPDLLHKLRNEAGNDGFVDRFLFSYPDATPSHLTFDGVAPATDESALALFRRLRGTGPAGPVVELDDAARLLWEPWYNQAQDAATIAEHGMAGVLAKMPGQAARLALVLHTLWDPDRLNPTLSADRLADALTMAAYFRDHAARVLACFGGVVESPVNGLPGRVRHALEQSETWLDRTELHRWLGNHVKTDELEGVLQSLLADDVVERRDRPTATRSAEQWRLAPSPRERTNNDEESDCSERIVRNDSFVRTTLHDADPREIRQWEG